MVGGMVTDALMSVRLGESPVVRAVYACVSNFRLQLMSKSGSELPRVVGYLRSLSLQSTFRRRHLHETAVKF